VNMHSTATNFQRGPGENIAFVLDKKMASHRRR
jgi:hypothetical protein